MSRIRRHGCRLLGVLALLVVVAAGVAPASYPDGGLLAPVPSVADGTVQWSAVGLDASYKVAVSTDARGTDDRRTVYVDVPSGPGPVQSYAPEVPTDGSVYVGISADGGHTWSATEAVVSDPDLGTSTSGNSTNEGEEAEQEVLEGTAEADSVAASVKREAKVQVTPPSSAIIGTDDGSGWGPAPAKTLIDGGITWSREEVGYDSIAGSVQDGFKVLAIVANTSDSAPLSQTNPTEWGAMVVSQLRENPGISIAEAGNETYLKGGVANPVQYGRMYLAAIDDMKAAKITTPLLFNMTGDYPRTGTWSSPGSWSKDSAGGGWLRDAVNGVPGLGSAILANGVAIHPYGSIGENRDDDYGVSAPAAEESVAKAVLGSVPKFYITEFGYDLKACGRDDGACSSREQASNLQSAYDVFLGDPHIFGIWWYQSHDDSTGHFGLLSDKSKPRPSFKTLSAIAHEEGH